MTKMLFVAQPRQCLVPGSAWAVRQIAVSQFSFDATFVLMKSEDSEGTLVHGGFTPLNEMV